MAFLPPRERDRDVQRRRTFILRKYLLKKLLAGDSIRRALVVRSYWRIDYSRSRSPSSATLVYAECMDSWFCYVADPRTNDGMLIQG
ncbi:hypothetical protein E4U27_004333 [Claviceps purpurea]|nr:hypothetical protein E4U27_004333 [Claviceps purpurea]